MRQLVSVLDVSVSVSKCVSQSVSVSVGQCVSQSVYQMSMCHSDLVSVCQSVSVSDSQPVLLNQRVRVIVYYN